MSQDTMRPGGGTRPAPKTPYNLTAINTNKLIAVGGTYITALK